MSSKADMISTKIDPVSRNAIWREHVKKEERSQVLRLDFTMNPKTMYGLTDKPNKATWKPKNHGENEHEIADVTRALAEAELPPKQRYHWPQTSSMEIGWMTDPLLEREKGDQWTHGIVSCDITKYAERYVESQGHNPYCNAKPS
eukprot:CAMPEP_0175102340 /NCGR_PEP_ID=MMETSP0086_2-20121207/8378_1 /TAXON_ID=136419 /ORGANISM="Unknown Unknown, Strain D1" /LENGTH=144 /DNA_ID=CAMNT_0016377131 /DNA_START=25 /DNA_END=459 /DNA_ORIENTATION=-